jgi:hypothetical protein
MSNLLPLTPTTLIQCLHGLSGLKGIWLQPTEALFWLIGYHEKLTVDQARSLVKRYHLEEQKAYLRLGDNHKSPGVYGQGPDGTEWCLFHFLKA